MTSALMVLAVGLTFAFNNCGDPHIGLLPQVISPYAPPVSGQVCVSPQDSSQPYILSAFTVINITSAYTQGVLSADSDADGIADSAEAALGFDPGNRRSDGIHLDGVCLALGGRAQCAQSSAAPPQCATSVNAMGLADCDVQALNLQILFPHPNQGIDSDKDGIPDLVEIARGTLPGQFDSTADPDGDGFLNQQEFADGLDPRTPSVLSQRAQNVTLAQDQTAACAGGSFSFNIQNFAVFPTQAFTDQDVAAPDPTGKLGNLSYSHAAGENLLLITYKSTPVAQQVTTAQVWGTIVKVSSLSTANQNLIPLVVKPTDFQLLGSVLK